MAPLFKFHSQTVHIFRGSRHICDALLQNCEKLLLVSCPSVCPHGRIRLPIDGFSLNFTFQDFSKICRQFWGLPSSLCLNKLYGEVDSIKNTTINIWWFISNVKTTCFGLYRPSWGLGIFYTTLLARKLLRPEDGRYRPKHVIFTLLINTII